MDQQWDLLNVSKNSEYHSQTPPVHSCVGAVTALFAMALSRLAVKELALNMMPIKRD